MFRRNDGAGNTGYGYEENLKKAINRCRGYNSNTALIKSCCNYYQVDYYEVIRAIKHEQNEE